MGISTVLINQLKLSLSSCFVSLYLALVPQCQQVQLLRRAGSWDVFFLLLLLVKVVNVGMVAETSNNVWRELIVMVQTLMMGTITVHSLKFRFGKIDWHELGKK